MPDPVAAAQKLIGTPYVWGGDCPQGVDCSGLVHQAYPGLPRVAHEQKNASQQFNDPSQLQAGDLVFLHGTQKGLPQSYASHVGIYDGQGNVIHASSVHGKVMQVPLAHFMNSPQFYGFGHPQGNNAMALQKPQQKQQGRSVMLPNGQVVPLPQVPLASPTAAVPAQGGVTPNPAFAAMMSPDNLPPRPVAPDFAPLLLQRQQELQAAAQNPAQNPLVMEQLRANGQQAQLAAQQAAMPVVNPQDPRYNYTAYQPDALPKHQQIDIPTRPAPGNDPESRIFSLLAGAVDPINAGHYGAAPMQAALGYANQQYDDKQQQYTLAQQQADRMYNDQLRQFENAQQIALMNRQGAQQAAASIGNAQDKRAYEQADVVGQQAGLQSTLGALGNQPTTYRDTTTAGGFPISVPVRNPGLIDQSKAAIGAGVNAAVDEEHINLLEKQYQQALLDYKNEIDPVTRMQRLLATQEAKRKLQDSEDAAKLDREKKALDNKLTVTGLNNTAKTGIAQGHDAVTLHGQGLVHSDKVAALAQNNKQFNEKLEGKAATYQPAKDAFALYQSAQKRWNQADAAYNKAAGNPLSVANLGALAADRDRKSKDVEDARQTYLRETENAKKQAPVTPSHGARTGTSSAHQPAAPSGFSNIRISP
jgi:hypothetical protein